LSLFITRAAIMVSERSDDEPKFNGSNWIDLNRVLALARFQFIQDDDYDTNDPRKCAYVASCFEGPALDWVASAHTSTPAMFNDFDGFVTAVRQAFGIADNNITALLRSELDQLRWGSDVPVFFAEFDRLVLALNISDHGTRIAMVEAKLPHQIKVLLSEQALSFSNYDTMRERLNCMWAIDPNRKKTGEDSKKPRCGNCGKKGHTAAECRGSKK
jgi:hypothetical protein